MPLHLAALIAVFLSGILSMGFQLLGSRLLAPYFGTSIIVWAFLISTFLGAFSIGSMLGGRISRMPVQLRDRCRLAVAAVGIAGFALTAFLGRDVIAGIDSTGVSLPVGAFLACLALFLLPVTTLSCWPPMVTEALAVLGMRPGYAAGMVYGVSTVGNIAGVMMTAFLLIPNMRVSTMTIGWCLTAIAVKAVLIWVLRRGDRAGGDRNGSTVGERDSG